MKMINFLQYWFLVGMHLGDIVDSLAETGLSDKHLKIAMDLWYPWLYWKCIPLYLQTPKSINFVEEDMYIFNKDCPNDEYRAYGGVMWELLMFMKQARSFNFTIVHPLDPQAWGGYCYDDHNCTGMAGIVNRREADFALGKKPHTRK